MHKWKLVVAAIAASATCAWGQGRDPVETRLEARKVVRAADGAETLASADAAKPGETLEYAATYRNTGKRAVTNLAATLPIPANTELIPGSARPANAQASVDGRTFAAPPLKRRVVRDGKTVEVEIPAREYRYLRWNAPELGGEQTLTYTARVKVVDAVAPPEPSPGTKGSSHIERDRPKGRSRVVQEAVNQRKATSCRQ